ncbi:MAG: phage terminase small subunit P27 family [Gammaproteobacteria bacterium]
MSHRPLPTALKLFKGTAQNCRLNPNEPQPDSDQIKKPDHLSKKASKQWDLIYKHLESAGILTNVDVDGMELYCEAYARWTEANEKIRKHGMVIKSAQGYPIRSPFLVISNDCFDQMRKMMVEFGMTPSSRTKISATPKKEKNEFDDF